MKLEIKLIILYLNKQILCEKLGILFLYVYEDQWIYNKNELLDDIISDPFKFKVSGKFQDRWWNLEFFNFLKNKNDYIVLELPSKIWY